MIDRGDWMQTYTGIHYHPADPRPEEVHILDIAHALANTCRFNGHCHTFYSVAQHSVIVSLNVMPRNAQWALLHDAAEAYVGDLIRPMKQGELKRVFAEIEDKSLRAIAERFGLEWPMNDEVDIKNHDIQALSTEGRDLFDDCKEWGVVQAVVPYPERIVPLPPAEAEALFMKRYVELFETP